MTEEGGRAADAITLWAALFAVGRAVPGARLAVVLGWAPEDLDAASARLAEHLDAIEAPVALERVGSGLQLVLRPRYHALARMLVGEAPTRLSSAALESLAVVAYGQPASRTDVEAARGVRAERSLALLLERGLIHEVARPRGASADDGPFYATTAEFLQAFGLASLADLPPWPGGDGPGPGATRQAHLALGQEPADAPAAPGSGG